MRKVPPANAVKIPPAGTYGHPKETVAPGQVSRTNCRKESPPFEPSSMFSPWAFDQPKIATVAIHISRVKSTFFALNREAAFLPTISAYGTRF
jgi:hypothetical protein